MKNILMWIMKVLCRTKVLEWYAWFSVRSRFVPSTQRVRCLKEYHTSLTRNILCNIDSLNEFVRRGTLVCVPPGIYSAITYDKAFNRYLIVSRNSRAWNTGQWSWVPEHMRPGIWVDERLIRQRYFKLVKNSLASIGVSNVPGDFPKLQAQREFPQNAMDQQEVDRAQ